MATSLGPYDGGLINNVIAFTNMSGAGVSAANQATIRYNNNTTQFEQSISTGGRVVIGLA